MVFFVLYGKEISDPDTLHANDEVVSQLLSPIVRQRNVAGLGWMRDVLSNDSAFLFNASAEHAVEELETRIRHCISEPNDDEAQTTIAEIASLLGIEALRTESASEDDVPADEEST